MPSNRYFCPSVFHKGETLILENEEFTHLSRVMRKKSGDIVELVNGKGNLAFAEVVHIKKDQAELICTSIQVAHNKEPEIILALSIPKLNRLEFILEKGTELGCTSFWLFPAEHSEKEHFTQNQQKRMHNILIAAMKQCGRLFLPTIQVLPELKAWDRPSGTLLFGDTKEGAQTLLSYCQGNKLVRPVIFFVGPEAGFTPAEVTLLEGKLGAKGVNLHPNILRVDTAALCALSLISSLLNS